MIINSPNSYFSNLLEICDLRFRAWQSEPGMTSLHLWLWVNVLTCGNVWGQSQQLRLSVTPEHSQSAVMMWPVVCTPGHLLMAQSMETCWYSCGFTFQGHSDAAGHFFHHLKHLIFPTFLLLCGVTCFPALQIKPHKACEFEAQMRDTQKKCWITWWHLPGAPVHTSVLCSNCSLQETCWSSRCGYHSTLNPGVWVLLNHWVLTHCLWMCLQEYFPCTLKGERILECFASLQSSSTQDSRLDFFGVL